MGCPFVLKLYISKDGQSLMVKEFTHKHNHETSKQSYEHLPRQRKLNEDDRNNVQLLMEMQANKKLVQQHVKKITGRKITLKDLHNIDKKRTVSLPEIVHELREMNGGLENRNLCEQRKCDARYVFAESKDALHVSSLSGGVDGRCNLQTE
eukprot:Seg1574.6 transcript_id=Seg1574.6/GoldUCD/mRNA.D3Y31 product="hypothetical protein" protein_id=Seg1574.6/GoldUCD/D3Y31